MACGERREGELITHDKGYYHALKKHIRDLPRPTTRQPSFLSPKTPARATALAAIVQHGGPAAVFAAAEFLYAAAPGMVSNWSRY